MLPVYYIQFAYETDRYTQEKKPKNFSLKYNISWVCMYVCMYDYYIYK